MQFSIISQFLALAALAAGATLPRHVSHERRHAPLRNWQKTGPIDAKVKLPMRIGMSQSNLHKGDELLMSVSHHESPKYGQYFSAEEVADIFAPALETVSVLKEWLESMGVSSGRVSQSANKQWLQFDAEVQEAERLFRTEYYHYEHGSTGQKTVACDEYFLPEHVREHVDYITPGLKLMAGGKATTSKLAERENEHEKRGFRTSSKSPFSGPIIGSTLSNSTLNLIKQVQLQHCDQYITPACIAALYQIPQGTKKAANNKLGIFEEGDFYGAQDLVEFFATLAPNIPITTQPTVQGIDGGFAPSLVDGAESDLDLQISYPIIYPQQTIVFQTDDIFYASGLEGGGGFLNTFFDAIDGSYCTYSAFGETGDASIDPVYPDPNILGYQGQRQCGVYKPTNVISISYGEQEDNLPTNYQQRQCSEIMKLGMQGVTVVVASGDSGVAARSTDDNNADGCLGTGQVFNPDFPASCPYITALGATYLPSGADYKTDAEVAVTRFPSGGGFSNIYPRPSYQDSTLSSYFANSNPPYNSYSLTTPTNNPTAAQYGNGIYNKAGRGYPDAAAVGDNVVIFNNGLPTTIGGTSASAPVFAAMINRINEERIAAGKSTVGFVNPVLYAHPEMFHDITTGSNPGCNTNGFSAVPGWDPVTGLGTPNYPKMLSVFMAQP
ncbi:Protease S8 tripeptidyl peptidase I [Taphrina deformans PYCC 5710]|uniref:Protease S8 tripeptidyl peptidase I n=1 Tax=Taphrina deformans (strain PYCC 5710 / ATCC 11124 / CBS 356.35 / IMI 108563 / JCM 9778 / NBRC 8474) TaxID=1097556 RepID=R4XAG0_TAPDE|nr:Protease S8 tripeptidyl peptidase I [Taphrina deformans PYCC 5710]|eukprot:CCG82492.1 Protease S8 tripeptidyl peptidase I [Taphrina deformans PYCC 5710]